MPLQEELEILRKEVKNYLQEIARGEALSQYEFSILGRKGKFTELAKKIAQAPAEEKPAIGKQINELKHELEEKFQVKKQEFHAQTTDADMIDVSLPGAFQQYGHLHLVTRAIEEIERIFVPLGFSRMSYNEIEWDYYAFEALNMPRWHPARDEWETFFISEDVVGPKGRVLLTPHTSSGQVREMQKRSAKGQGVRMINIAKCYRRQSDISHVPMFHQFEGLAVDRSVTMRELIGTVEYFVKNFFGKKRKVRLRPYHFRFTEPSFEIDVTCGICNAKGCQYCKDGWSEIAGAGMVHPNVLKAGGYDPKKYTGFAFGFGVERSYMMKNNLNIGDLRLLYSNDIRFLEQF
ncbi:phenylalanine--tRNA ligase subunit alpha [Candidatus Uhrbacteria bacterium]|nr:phenylalanine--tRNA ligase subunit alpha [Candidatus Uhrbacteria bacterium]